MFPLPGVVLFPGTALPLHVFEPRYKELTSTALEGSREIAIAQLRPGWDKDYHGMPPVFRVMTVGEIIEHRQLPDGRYDIVLRGRYRARLQEERPAGQSPFRMGLLTPLEEFHTQDHDVPESAIFLKDILQGLLRQGVIQSMDRDCVMAEDQQLNVGVIADVLAQVFCSNPYDLQGILEETNVVRRAQLVEVQVRRELERKDLA
jgi:Lon protease-like protein